MKKILHCFVFDLFFIVLFSFPVCLKAQIIHVIVITSGETESGAKADQNQLLSFTNQVRDATGVPVFVKFVDSSIATKNYVDELIIEANIQPNDVLWVYYSGNGLNYDNWPCTPAQLSATQVYNSAKSTNCRLSITTFDTSCKGEAKAEVSRLIPNKTTDDPLISKSKEISPLKSLFLDSKGNFLATSCEANAFSYGSTASGGVFTNSLLGEMESRSNWVEVLNIAAYNTKKTADRLGYVQSPQFVIENYSVIPSNGLPFIEIQAIDNIDGIIEQIQRIFNNSTKRKVDVAFDDLKRWNPEFNLENLNGYIGGKLYFDLDDPLVSELSSKNHIPMFPNPPQCAQRYSLQNNLFPRYKTLAELDEYLRQVLSANGYDQRSYYQYPGGFALVTKLEQFNTDGSSKSGDGRWAEYPVNEDFTGVWNYISDVISPPPGRYRLFVFIVTNRGYSLNNNRRLSRKEAEDWNNNGLSSLPANIADDTTSKYHALDVLVYEFETPLTTKKCELKCNDVKDIRTHLEKSGIGLNKI